VSETAASPPPVPGAPRRHRLRSSLLTILGIVLVVVLTLAAYLWLAPAGIANASPDSQPARSYEEALERFDAIAGRQAADPSLMPDCHNRLSEHGRSTDTVIVLFHGYTNCPAQSHELADELTDLGYTVYVPLMPHHGEVDREHSTLDKLTSEQLVRYGNDAVDLAAGLGDHVVVMGLSGGGTVAAYLAQFRDDVDLAVPMAAFLGLASVPDWLASPLVNLAGLLPPIGLGESADSAAGSGVYAPYASFDNNTRAAAAYMRLARTVLADAARTPHRARHTIVVINQADDTVNVSMLDTLESRWEALAPDASTGYRFDASLGLPHDLIGPDRVDQRIDTVYPVLLDLLQSP